MAGKPPPDPGRCNKAIKILEQFERLANKFALKIPQKRLNRLRQLRDSGRIQSKDLPAKLLREFPDDFAGMTLNAIRRACGKKS